jgi:hypothetical protein
MSDGPNGSSFTEILPLAPLQSGLFFEHLLSGKTSDAYIVQLVLSVRGPLDPVRLRAAAAAMLVRHPNLRAAFLHEGLSQPVQVVPETVDLPWREQDCSQAGAGEEAELLRGFAAAEQREGFDLRRPPGLRFMVVRWSAVRHSVIFTHHHILLDGWSLGIFVHQLFELYEENGAGTALPPPTPYRDYFSWLSGRDSGAAQEAWLRELAGARPASLGMALGTGADGAGLAASRHAGLSLTLSSSVSARLAEIARARHLTMSTMFLGLWGVGLGSIVGSTDVVFGTTISGRSPEINGVESAVGLYANTVPVRVSWSAWDPISEILTGLQ